MLIKNSKDLSNHKHLHNDVCVSLHHNTLSPSILAQACPSHIAKWRVPKWRVPLRQKQPFSTDDAIITCVQISDKLRHTWCQCSKDKGKISDIINLSWLLFNLWLIKSKNYRHPGMSPHFQFYTSKIFFEGINNLWLLSASCKA